MEPELNNNASGSGNPKEEATSNKDFKKKYKDLWEEDLALKQRLDLDVQRVQDADQGLQKVALESMRQEIRTSTSSMTSVPKPLKFLRPHYGTLKSFYKTMPDSSDSKKLLADILSVLALTMPAEGDLESLKYQLLGSKGDIDFWGHVYVRNLAGEIPQEYAKRIKEEESVDDLIQLVKQIVAFHMKHNLEHEAVDLVMEVEFPQILVDSVDSTNYKRTCLYLTNSTRYPPEPDGEIQSLLEIAFKIYIKFEDYPRALLIALYLDKMQHVKQIFTSCPDILMKKQFCSILARQGVSIEIDEEMCADDDEREALQEIVNNTKLSEGYITLARDIEVMEPKSPEDIYKEEMIGEWSSDDSKTQYLAAAFVNAFVNAGFGQDTLMTVPSDASSGSTSGNWFFKNRGHGKASAAASLGMIYLWDVDAGLAQIEKYFDSNDNQVIAGALLGVGIVNCGIKNDCDPALALLADYLDNKDSSIRIGAITGLAFAYAGTQNKQICEKLIPILGDPKAPLDVVAFTAIALGLVCVGSCNEDVAQALISAVIIRSELDSGDPLTPLLPLGLSLLYLGKKDRVDSAYEDETELSYKITRAWFVTLQSCAYAGTGDPCLVEYCLQQCAKHPEVETCQGPAVLGIAMVAMAEEIGLDMAIRLLEHLLKYGTPNARKAVPLALALLCISNPKVHVVDTLSRLTHDDDTEVAMTAVISLGLIGAGTNNARIAGMLRNLSAASEDLSVFHSKKGFFFCVRIAQGLVHMGKGLLTLAPYHSERFLLSPKALAGLVVFLNACLDMKSMILGKYHYVLYFLVLAMQPRMLLTVDENLQPLSVPVQVGKAVDVVGQVGQPKTITGFQTHSTPVLLAAGDRAELATDKYIPLSPILEGFVILKENPDYREEA